MKGGRKNLKRAAEDGTFTLPQDHTIMRVLSLRGSNLIEVMDAKVDKELALFPAKFKKSMWIKLGSFVVVDERGREEAIDSGRKVTCIVSQVLFHDQVRILQKSLERPEIFKSKTLGGGGENLQGESSRQDENEFNSGEDDADGLPPIEANMNRRKPLELQSDLGSDSDTDSSYQNL